MKFSLTAIVLIGMGLASGCDDSSKAPDVSALSWSELKYLPNGVHLLFLKVGDDQALYGAGLRDDQISFVRQSGNSWHEVAVADATSIVDFTVYHDTVYFSTLTGVSKARDSFVEPMLIGNRIIGIEVYQDQLFMSGEGIVYQGKKYSIMAYDGVTFHPIDDAFQSSKMTVANNKLFISGDQLKVYDGSQLAISKYPGGGFFNVDQEESVYSWMQMSNGFHITMFQNEGYHDVGDIIRTGSIANALEFFRQTIVFTAVDAVSSVWHAYYLNEKDHWVEINTAPHLITSLTAFNGSVLAVTITGGLLELTSVQ